MVGLHFDETGERVGRDPRRGRSNSLHGAAIFHAAFGAFLKVVLVCAGGRSIPFPVSRSSMVNSCTLACLPDGDA